MTESVTSGGPCCACLHVESYTESVPDYPDETAPSGWVRGAVTQGWRCAACSANFVQWLDWYDRGNIGDFATIVKAVAAIPPHAYRAEVFDCDERRIVVEWERDD